MYHTSHSQVRAVNFTLRIFLNFSIRVPDRRLTFYISHLILKWIKYVREHTFHFFTPNTFLNHLVRIYDIQHIYHGLIIHRSLNFHQIFRVQRYRLNQSFLRFLFQHMYNEFLQSHSNLLNSCFFFIHQSFNRGRFSDNVHNTHIYKLLCSAYIPHDRKTRRVVKWLKKTVSTVIGFIGWQEIENSKTRSYRCHELFFGHRAVEDVGLNNEHDTSNRI